MEAGANLQHATKNSPWLAAASMRGLPGLLVRRLVRVPGLQFVAGRLLAYHLAKAIVAETQTAGLGRGKGKTVLALSWARFRGELPALDASGHFRILVMPRNWQTRILQWFWTKELTATVDLSRQYLRADGSSWIGRIRSRVQQFLGIVIAALFRRLEIDAVIGPTIWYAEDLDWGITSQRLGFPYVVLHVENLASAPGHVRRLIYNANCLGRFQGSEVIVYNELCRAAFVEGGFIEPERIHALGSLRMDPFVRRVAEEHKRGRAGQRRALTLFSFHRGAGLWGLSDYFPDDPNHGLTAFFQDVHATVGRFAADNPDIDVFIKPKWSQRWVAEIERAMEKSGVRLNRTPNLRIVTDVDAQELIFASDLVCGYGSTTLLEAGVAGRHVVMPLFAETTRPDYQDYLHFRDELDAFVVPRSAEAFRAALDAYFAHPTLDEVRYKRICEVFERHVSPLDGQSLDRYVAKLEAILS